MLTWGPEDYSTRRDPRGISRLNRNGFSPVEPQPNRTVKQTILTLGLLFILSGHLDAQRWGGDQKGGFWRYYSVGVNAGILSYFGDLSQYDSDPANKLRYESKPGLSVIATKHILHKFGVSGQILYGKLQGAGSKQSFSTSLLEYNLHLRTDLVGLIFPGKNHRFGFEPYAGIGQFIFNSTTTSYRNELATKEEIRSRVPEFVYFAGAGVTYNLPASLSISADMGLRQCRNDKLDGLVKNDNFDYYTYLSIGITYHISSLARQPMKNKARLAHNETFLSHRKRIRTN